MRSDRHRMPERMSHESYVASVRGKVVELAKRMLGGQLSFLEGALAALIH